MLLLAVETSGTQGSVALARTGGSTPQIWSESWDKKAIHSEVATAVVENVLQTAGVAYSDLTHLAVNVGPGSFTGLRVGINLVRTMAFSLAIPVAGLNSLELLCSREGRLGARTLVAIKAIQNFYYCGVYKKNADGVEELHAPCSRAFDELDSLKKGADMYLIEGETPGFTPELSARTLVELAGRASSNSRFLSWEFAIPLYIRGSEAEEKMRRGVLRK